MALLCAPLRATINRPGTLLRHLSRTVPQSEASTSALCKPVVRPYVLGHVRGVCALPRPIPGFLSPASHVSPVQSPSILSRVTPLLSSILQQPARPITYCSLRKGKRKSVRAVTDRFMRLHCGLWIRKKAGSAKKLWKKTARRKKRLREIVFCNKTQSTLLDKMTTSYWKRRNWYLNDPYQKYHDRTNLRFK